MTNMTEPASSILGYQVSDSVGLAMPMIIIAVIVYFILRIVSYLNQR